MSCKSGFSLVSRGILLEWKGEYLSNVVKNDMQLPNLTFFNENKQQTRLSSLMPILRCNGLAGARWKLDKGIRT